MKAFNPIISKSFIYSDLKFADDGLYYVNKRNNDRDEILLSKSYKDILSLLDIDMDELNDMTEEEFFASIINNPKIRIEKFFNLKDDNKVEIFQNFYNYLQDNNVEIRKGYQKITFEDLEEITEDLTTKLEESDIWLDGKKRINQIFNGATIKKHFPNYDMTQLSETLPMYRSKFNNKKEFGLWILMTDEKTIHEDFIKETTKVI